MTFNQRLDAILPKITSPSFKAGSNTGNEVNFHIFDYDSKDEMAVREHIDYLVAKVNSEYTDIHIVNFDLYEIMIQLIREKGYFGKVIKMEQSKNSDNVINPVKRALRLTLDSDMIVKYIKDNTNQEKDIVILSGIGKAWPIIRSHTILNNLHSIIINTPLIAFFPGTYNGLKLELFGEFTDDNYYRAFRLVER